MRAHRLVSGSAPCIAGDRQNHNSDPVSIVRREAAAILTGLRAMDRQREPVSLGELFNRAAKGG